MAHAGGRPTKYHPVFSPKLAEAFARLGLTDEQIAEKLEVSVSTLTNWKAAHPEFVAALKTGKEVPDDRVERSLFERATGYAHEAVKIFLGRDGKPLYAPYVERFAPDPTSMIFWLKNRRPDRWRDRHEVSGEVELVHIERPPRPDVQAHPKAD